MIKLGKRKEIARGFSVPVNADLVDSPEVVYGQSITAIYFTTEDEKYCRATFENIDSIRMCRGEHCPYENSWVEGEPYYWVCKVENSSWLIERHKYESKYYKQAYNFGGDVDEMLTEFSHYLLNFHDEFVEILAAGLWFEISDEPFTGSEPTHDHPLMPLPEEGMDYLDAHDLVVSA